MPPPFEPLEPPDDAPLDALPVLSTWVRGSLLGLAGGLVTVFAVAAWLDPYDGLGQPRRMATHRQLGLPPCTFYSCSGLPCPSCGMTTSFALLVHGDPVNSLRANAAGTLLALFCLALVPWSLASALRGQPLWIVSVERTFTWVVLVFMALMLLRWGVVVSLHWGELRSPFGTPGASPPGE